MRVTLWPAKAAGEKVGATFRYQKALAAGESIQSVVIQVSVKAGVDAAPAAILSGAAVLLAGGRVWQLLQDGLPGVSYQVLCRATTNTGQVLYAAGVLPIEE